MMTAAACVLDLSEHPVKIERRRLLTRRVFYEIFDLLSHQSLHPVQEVSVRDNPIPIGV